MYESFWEKLGILFHRLIKNHPLQDGNKRTAVATLYFVLNNLTDPPYSLNTTDKDIEKSAEQAAAGELDEEDLIEWIKIIAKPRSE